MYSEWTHLLEIEWRWSLCALALEISFVSLMRALFSTYRWAYSCKQLGLGKIGGYINFSILHSCFYLSSKTTAALIPCTLLGMAGCIWSKIPAILMQTEPIWKQLGNGTLYSVARVVQWLPKGDQICIDGSFQFQKMAQQDLDMRFDANQCDIYRANDLVVSAKREGNAYTLNVWHERAMVDEHKTVESKWELAYAGSGHPNQNRYDKIQQSTGVCQNFSDKDGNLCSGCLQGKMIAVKFPTNRTWRKCRYYNNFGHSKCVYY